MKEQRPSGKETQHFILHMLETIFLIVTAADQASSVVSIGKTAAVHSSRYLLWANSSTLDRGTWLYADLVTSGRTGGRKKVFMLESQLLSFTTSKSYFLLPCPPSLCVLSHNTSQWKDGREGQVKVQFCAFHLYSTFVFHESFFFQYSFRQTGRQTVSCSHAIIVGSSQDPSDPL